MTENYEILIKKIDEFIRKYYRNQLINGIIWFFAILFFSFLLFIFIEYFGQFGILLRSILFYLFFIVNATSFIFFVGIKLLKIKRIGKIISHEQAATIIGKHFREIKDKLLNVLQLNKLKETNKVNIDLLKAGIDQKIIQIKPIPFIKAVDFSKNLKFIKYALFPILIFIFLILIFPKIILKPSERILHYLNVYIEEMPYKINILNKSLETFQQEDFILEIKIQGEILPSEILIENEGALFKMNKISRISFSYTFKAPQKSEKFCFHLGKYKSKDFILRVYPKPNILSFETTLYYPNYLKRTNEKFENTGDLIVPEGTRINWKYFTKDVEKLTIRFNDKEKTIEDKKRNIFEYSTTFEKSTFYSIKVSNKYKQLKDSLSYTITVIPDAYPFITVKEEKETGIEMHLFYQGIIRDDYGFSRLKFIYSIINGSDSSEKISNSTNLVFNKDLNQQSFNYSLNLNEWIKKPGDELDYYFEVCDNDALHGPKCTRTGLIKYMAPTLMEIEKNILKKEQSIASSIKKSTNDAKDLQKKIEELNKKIIGKTNLTWQDKKQIQDLLNKQTTISENLEKIKQEYEQKNKEEQFYNENQTIFEKQKQVDELFNEVMDNDTKKLVEEFKKMLDKIDKNQVNELLEKLKLSNKDIEKELDRNLQLLKQVEFDKKLTESIDKLKELSNRQEQLSENSLNNEKDNNKLQNVQNDIKKEFDNEKNTLNELREKSKELEDTPKLPDVSKEESDIDKDLDNSVEFLQRNNYKNASNIQKDASERMKSMSEKLKSEQEDLENEQSEEDLSMLRQILEDLVRISFDQEDQMKRTKVINKSDPKYLRLIQDQNNLKDDLGSVEDSLNKLAKWEIMVKPFILREISSINNNINNSVKFLNDRDISNAIIKQQLVMTSVNNLALMLSKILKQIEEHEKQKNSMKGSGSCSKPGGLGKKMSMKSIKGMQEQLNKQIGEMKKEIEGMRSGQEKNGNNAKKMISEKLARLAAQQEAIRDEMNKYSEQLKQDGINDKGAMSDLIKKMEETQKDLINRKILKETINRQNEILTKMLESEKAEINRGEEEQRQSKEALNQKISNPFLNFKYNSIKNATTDLMKTTEPSYNYYYKNKINTYFLKFK